MGGDNALTTGTLRIADECVVLEGIDGSTTLPVWSAEQTTWDQGSHNILFKRRDGRVINLTDGQQVGLGGSGVAFDGEEAGIEGMSWEEWVDSIDWQAEPHPSCSVDSSWSVGDVLLAP